MKNVLIVNQSAELYGSDKAILELIENFPDGYRPIVILHQDGPLKIRLEEKGVKVITSSVIKIKRGIFSISYLLQLPFEIIGAIIKIRKSLGPVKIDLVHSNSISVFIGAFYAFFFRKKHLWHVHEIIEHPAAAAKFYPKIVAAFSDIVAFNSNASFAQFYKFCPKIAGKSVVIHNGQSRTSPLSGATANTAFKSGTFGFGNEHLLIGLVGRISRLKGQKVLLEAFNKLIVKYPDIRLAYIGSPPDGQAQFLTDLENNIAGFNLKPYVSIVDFQKNIWPVYDALDIIVVPSTEPESFGLVATEAMLSGKPVVGSDLGGLREVISNNETGFLFPAGDAEKLALRLEQLITDAEMRQRFGAAGMARVKQHFNTEKFASGFKTAYDKLTD